MVFLLVTIAPSSAEAPSPSSKIFLNTLASPITSITGLNDTNSISIFRVEHDGIEGNPLPATLPTSPKASAITLQITGTFSQSKNCFQSLNNILKLKVKSKSVFLMYQQISLTHVPVKELGVFNQIHKSYILEKNN